MVEQLDRLYLLVICIKLTSIECIVWLVIILLAEIWIHIDVGLIAISCEVGIVYGRQDARDQSLKDVRN